MRVIQIWQRLSVRERTLAGVAVAALLLVIVRYGIVEPYRDYTAGLEEEIEQEVQRVAKMQRQHARSEPVDARLTALREHFQDTWTNLIPGETPALAAAELQEHVRSLASQSGLDLVTTQVMREVTVGSFRKVGVQVTMRGELPAVATFLGKVEYGNWRLAVSTLEVRSTYNVRLPRGTGQSPLTITMEVSGVMQGEAMPPVAEDTQGN